MTSDFECEGCGNDSYTIETTTPVRTNPSHSPKGGAKYYVCEDCGRKHKQ